jgi:putative ABC transport system permease protein
MGLWLNVKYALRQLAAAPGFAAVAVLTFALGIGATTAIFSAVYAVVLQPFPFDEPDRVVTLGEDFGDGVLSSVSPGNFEDWRMQSTSFSEIGARRFLSVNVSGGATPERLQGAAVTASYFSVFRIPPALGRTFRTEENQAGRDGVVLLSHRLWTRMFGGDAAILGRSLRLDGRAYEVVGVMPRQFDRLGGVEDFWIPVVFQPDIVASHDEHGMDVSARLAPGLSREQAGAELSVIFDRMKARLPSNTQVRRGLVNDYAAAVIGDSRQRLLILFGAVALVLLIACGNVAHLLLARGHLRSHEVALRASLGASVGDLVGQFLAESLVLAAIGGALGIGVAYLAIPAMIAIGPAAAGLGAVPRLDQTAISAGVLLFAIAATVLSAVGSGIVPAIRAARPDLRSTLSGGSRTVAHSGDTLRGLLVAGEVALALVVLIGAGLFVRSAVYLQGVEPGYDGTNVLVARVSLPEVGYEPVRAEGTFQDLVARLSQHPGVESAAVTSAAPLEVDANNNGLVPEGKTFDPNDFVLGRLGLITDDYFRAFRIPLVDGRWFTADDRRGNQRVMILSQTAARQLFPDGNAVGKRVSCCEAGPDGIPVLKLVVGVVKDIRSEGPRAEARADFYLPIQQAPADVWRWTGRTMTVVVRSRTQDPAALAAVVRATVKEIDPAVPVHSVATMAQRLGSALAADRFNVQLMLLLGGIGLLLAAVGLYGVISCFVTQRRRELAIRMALGARSRDVARMVLNQGMRPVWLGVVAGVVAAAGLSNALSSFVYGVTTTDPLTFASVVVVLVLVAVLANLLPVRAAARVDPAGLLAN